MNIICHSCYSKDNFSVRVSPLGVSVLCNNCLNYYAIVDGKPENVDNWVYNSDNEASRFNQVI